MDDRMFAELEASLKQGMAILRGEEQPSRIFNSDIPNIKATRAALKLTQSQFAALIGVSVRTLQNWEQGRRVPEGPAPSFVDRGRAQPPGCAGRNPVQSVARRVGVDLSG